MKTSESGKTLKLRKVLIANRGEIVVRVARACDALGIATVAVYSDADAGAVHVGACAQAVRLGPPPPRESYLNVEALLEAARQTGADAVHPGYGFLSENAAFAEAVAAAGLVFIGPSPHAIRTMGSKTAARAAMEHSGVPVVPGYQAGGEPEDFAKAAAALGYPVLVKAAAGGGGKGMRVVHEAGELGEAIEGARREAGNAFGDERVYLEKYLDDSHHIEIQVLADAHGNTVHLFERECSVQRRHQKVLEESPSPNVDAALRAKMGAAAVAAAKAVGYVNAGTVEFMVDAARNFYFLEMNTRLQVEHPVTELVAGVDLVEAQLRIAGGERLWLTQESLCQRGHAIEGRLYAEDPAEGHLPSTGEILFARAPCAPGVRVDSGIETGSVVSHHYDPMLAKVIAYAEDRAAAIRKLDWALAHYPVLGVTTNASFLREILAHETFARGAATTRFLERTFVHAASPADASAAPRAAAPTATPGGGCPTSTDDAFLAAALAEHLLRATPASSGGEPHDEGAFDPWRTADGFRLGGN